MKKITTVMIFKKKIRDNQGITSFLYDIKSIILITIQMVFTMISVKSAIRNPSHDQ